MVQTIQGFRWKDDGKEEGDDIDEVKRLLYEN